MIPKLKALEYIFNAAGYGSVKIEAVHSIVYEIDAVDYGRGRSSNHGARDTRDILGRRENGKWKLDPKGVAARLEGPDFIKAIEDVMNYKEK